MAAPLRPSITGVYLLHAASDLESASGFQLMHHPRRLRVFGRGRPRVRGRGRPRARGRPQRAVIFLRMIL